MTYDIAIIGGGPAGYSAAYASIRCGLSVVLFEGMFLGGTCLNRGCVPTKFLSYVAEIYSLMHKAERYGVEFASASIDYMKALNQKTEIVERLRNVLKQQLELKKIKLISGWAQVIDSRHVVCGDTVYETENILIATGSVPKKLLINGAITSDELLKLKYIPKTLKVIGGGAVAVEFASIFNELGSNVIMMLRGDRILRKWDRELSISLMQNMRKKGILIQTRCNIEQMSAEEADVILDATGRKANLSGIERISLEIGLNGGIKTDRNGCTNISGIYAAGDVTDDSPQLAHVGMEQGKHVVQHIAGIQEQSSAAIVRCIYTNPEIASVGLTEAEAKDKGMGVVIAKQIMGANARTLITTTERGFIKLIAGVEDKKIKGAQLMCERAGDIVSELALAINSGLTVYDLIQSTRPHPSFCEAVTDAAQALADRINEL